MTGTVGARPPPAAGNLDLARDSLADARLLAERGRRNAAVLVDLALRQALGAISLSLGLDAPDGLGLDTLLGRVPNDHPASALVGRLADPRARDAEAVERLIDALSPAAPDAEPARIDRTTRKKPADPAPDARRQGAARAMQEPSAVVAGGPTAFEAARTGSRQPGREKSGPRDVSSVGFWALMDRWAVSDDDALALVGGERALTKAGTRPRFRLRGSEATRFAMLARIDTALQVQNKQPDWLSCAQEAAPFHGRTPLALLLADPDRAAEAILHMLNRAGLQVGPTEEVANADR